MLSGWLIMKVKELIKKLKKFKGGQIIYLVVDEGRTVIAVQDVTACPFINFKGEPSGVVLTVLDKLHRVDG